MYHGITGSEGLIKSLEWISGLVTSLSLKLAITILSIVLVWEIGKGVLFEDGKIEFKKLVRGLIVFFLIANYQEILNAISDFMQYALNAIPNYYNNLTEEEIRKAFPPGNDSLSMFNITFTEVIGFMFQWTLILIIKSAIFYFRTILLVFLYAAGPLALVISIIPGMETTAMKWFKNYISVFMWGFTLLILDYLLYFYATNGYVNLEDVAMPIPFIITMTLMYALTPFLTSKIVGYTSSGAFISKVMGAAAVMGAVGKAATAKNAATPKQEPVPVHANIINRDGTGNGMNGKGASMYKTTNIGFNQAINTQTIDN